MVVDDNNSNFLNRPVTLNSKNNLLEIEEHMYILDDVEKRALVSLDNNKVTAMKLGLNKQKYG